MQSEKPKPDEITGPPDKTIWREGVGQVRQWFDASGKLMREEVATFSFDATRPAKLTTTRRRKYEEWLKLHPPPEDIKWQFPASGYSSTAQECRLPEWVFVAHSELQGMYFPKLWARYTTHIAFSKDPKQIGYHCGYILAQSTYALEHPNEMEKRHPLAAQIVTSERPHVGKLMTLAINSTSLDYLRKFADAFAEAIRHDPFYIGTGRPVHSKRHNRFEALRYLLKHWTEVENDFVKRRRTRRDLHKWLVDNLKSYAVGQKATNKLCDAIGLRLRPHEK